jgi:ABC-2 type transport system permease protein
MNMTSNDAHGTPIDSHGTTLASASETHPIYWSLRREMWENRSIYLAPLLVTAFVLLGSLISVVTVPHRMRSLPMPDPARLQAMVLRPFHLAPAPIMLATFLVGFFYCLDALNGERRDRSIMFWKSLPVSDRATVLSKASIPLVVLPLIALALSVATQVVMLAVSTPLLMGSVVSAGRMWSELRFFEGMVIMFYGLTVHTLWFAPIYGALLLISAWARRAPFLWALLPLLAVVALERLAFNTTYVATMLQYRVTGAMREAFTWKPGAVGNVERLWQLEPANFLTTPGLWLGLAFAAACIAAAVRMRRNREPI